MLAGLIPVVVLEFVGAPQLEPDIKSRAGENCAGILRGETPKLGKELLIFHKEYHDPIDLQFRKTPTGVLPDVMRCLYPDQWLRSAGEYLASKRVIVIPERQNCKAWALGEGVELLRDQLNRSVSSWNLENYFAASHA